MVRKFPIIASVIALAAIGTMIGLGFWQWDRKAQKEDLLLRYGNASSLEPIAYPLNASLSNPPYYRRSSVDCVKVVRWLSVSGKNTKGQSGLAHIAQCKAVDAKEATNDANIEIAVGWSKSPAIPSWEGGLVSGIISQGRIKPIKLTVQQKVDGLEILAKPDPANIPNNHLVYMIQWFLFAFFAAVIYVLAVRKKMTFG